MKWGFCDHKVVSTRERIDARLDGALTFMISSGKRATAILFSACGSDYLWFIRFFHRGSRAVVDQAHFPHSNRAPRNFLNIICLWPRYSIFAQYTVVEQLRKSDKSLFSKNIVASTIDSIVNENSFGLKKKCMKTHVRSLVST